GTNYFTVQEAFAALAREGLIGSRPRTGTMVLRQRPIPTTVAVYFGGNITQGNSFYYALNSTIFRELEQQGLEPRLFIDSRKEEECDTACPHLERAIARHEIHGVIGLMLTPQRVQWLNRLEVPSMHFASGDHPNRVTLDRKRLYRDGIDQLKRRGCQRIAVLPHPSSLGGAYVDLFRLASDVQEVELLGSEDYRILKNYETQAEFAYVTFRERWKKGKVPDGLLIYPDVCAQGVISAILELQIRVPEELKLVLHMNDEMSYHCPLKVDWIQTKVRSLASAMIGNLNSLMKGEEVAVLELPLEIVEGYPR
ncbi:MAG: substrate-binding domain-containing protein, partial [Puniceicoccales bacterium]